MKALAVLLTPFENTTNMSETVVY